MSAFVPEVQPQLRMLCRSLARISQEYYKDPLHRQNLKMALRKMRRALYMDSRK